MRFVRIVDREILLKCFDPADSAMALTDAPAMTPVPRRRVEQDFSRPIFSQDFIGYRFIEDGNLDRFVSHASDPLSNGLGTSLAFAHFASQ